MCQSRTATAHRRPGTLGAAVRIAARRFAGDARGGPMIMFALLLPVLLAFVGGVLDFAYLSLQKTRLQAATDAAAVAAAREIHLASTKKSQLDAAVKAVLLANLGDEVNGLKVTTSVTGDPKQVNVDVEANAELFVLDQLIGAGGALSAHAAARPVGSMPICVLGLDEKQSQSIALNERSRLTGNGCAVYSNSLSSEGIVALSGAELTAALICSAGGTGGASSNYKPAPMTDCPKVEDPLASRPAPPIGGCDYNDFRIGGEQKMQANKGQNKKDLREEIADEGEEQVQDSVPVDEIGTGENVTLKPGVYCGGLLVGGNANVTLSPGVYVIKDGPLWVDQNARFEGDYVGFYFTGKKATLHFGANTYISLRAPKDGPLAGLLMYAKNIHQSFSTFQILSDNARVLEGTIYLPEGDLYIDADRPIADKSAYTAIVTRSMSLYAGPHLVLNTDYDQTDVPVPDGIANKTSDVMIVE